MFGIIFQRQTRCEKFSGGRFVFFLKFDKSLFLFLDELQREPPLIFEATIFGGGLLIWKA